MRAKGTPLQRLRTEVYVLTHDGEFVNQTQFAGMVDMNSSGIGLIEQGNAAPRESRYALWVRVLTGKHPGAFTVSDMTRLVPVARRMVVARRNGETAAANKAESEANAMIDRIIERIERMMGIAPVEAVG